MTMLATIATTLGIVSGLAYFPQAYKIIKRKSSKDISLITFSIFLCSILTWLLYGISIKNSPLIIANIINLVGAISVITVYIIYK